MTKTTDPRYLQHLQEEARSFFQQSPGYKYLTCIKNLCYLPITTLGFVSAINFSRDNIKTAIFSAATALLYLGCQHYIRHALRKIPEVNAQKIYDGELKSSRLETLAEADFRLDTLQEQLKQ